MRPRQASHRRGLRLVWPHAGWCRLAMPAACEPRPEAGASIRAARLSKFSEDTVAVANLCSQQSFHLVFAAALNLAVSLWLAAGAGRPRRTATCGAIALLLHRSTPPVDLPCVRARTAALVKMSLLFQRDFGLDNPAPDFQNSVKPPRVWFDFALNRATWRTEHSAQPTTRVLVPSSGQIDLEGAWVPPHAHVS